ncbi:L-seryl-tRNA(Sec) selenium transferase [Gracilibacillus sp. YIM 98692]|uniref:L-seryl-tRNA(Sec) selenium transferase n=1 Tax=Gracilibacillus sp. YIM 98692 TaxID=2663532 RepID=UPI0032046C1F
MDLKHLLRQLPPVHEFQSSDRFLDLVNRSGLMESQITKIIQQVIHDLRNQLLDDINPASLSRMSFADYIWMKTEENIQRFQQDRVTRVINGTGTVLHTNLGRARLSERAIEHVASVAANYSNLEYNMDEGKRGSRHDIIEDLLVEVTEAEAAMVVNNNAAAVYIILRALAKEKEVIVSRGQLIEIGGSFRVSSIMEESGATLVEVGTTNKTHLFDYENAINEETKMILKVHTSNFKTVGFTETVGTEELVQLKKQHDGVVLYEDLGSGSLYDFRKNGVGNEPVVREVIEAGVDLVSFSGDKLLGGPQAGIIVGKRSFIQQLKKHQLARVLRVDKMTLAGLEKTLLSYLMGNAAEELPTVRDIVKPLSDIEIQSKRFMKELQPYQNIYDLEVKKSTSQIGGGTMPDVYLPTYVVAISHKDYTAQELAGKIRMNKPAVIARIKDEKVLIDFRTVTNEEMDELIPAFLRLA